MEKIVNKSFETNFDDQKQRNLKKLEEKWAIIWTRIDGKENAEKLISFSFCTRLAVFLLLFAELLELDSVKDKII